MSKVNCSGNASPALSLAWNVAARVWSSAISAAAKVWRSGCAVGGGGEAVRPGHERPGGAARPHWRRRDRRPAARRAWPKRLPAGCRKERGTGCGPGCRRTAVSNSLSIAVATGRSASTICIRWAGSKSGVCSAEQTGLHGGVERAIGVVGLEQPFGDLDERLAAFGGGQPYAGDDDGAGILEAADGGLGLPGRKIVGDPVGARC